MKFSGLQFLIFLFGLIIYTELLIFLVQTFPFWNIKDFSEVFKNLSIGLGIISVGLGVFKILNDFSSPLGSSWRAGILKNKYNPLLIGSFFNLIESKDLPGKYYIYDFAENKKFLLASGATFTDLGFKPDQVVTLSIGDFDNILEGEPILTKGRWGS